MARQLPALVSSQRSISRSGNSHTSVARLLSALAPDIIRVAERMATQRLQNRDPGHAAAPLPDHTEAVHMSEIEIDVSMPFVRRITMRNMTAWQNGPAPQAEETKPSKSDIGRKIGLLGASSVLALCLGVIARRVGPFSDDGSRVIDIVGKPKP